MQVCKNLLLGFTLKQGLILIKFLPVNSILSAKKWWMITAVVGQNKRQYQVLPMHETLYDIILSFYKIIGTFRVANKITVGFKGDAVELMYI